MLCDKSDEGLHQDDRVGTEIRSSISRRQFLKIVGVAGATVSLGAGLGGLAAACGGGTTTTSGATTTNATSGATTTGATTATTVGESTTVSSSVETGREVKLGFMSPQTGALASFGTADKYTVESIQAFTKNGVILGDGKNHPISIILADMQSNSNRAGEVAGDLILNSKVDIIMGANAGDNVVPLSDQAEANGVPSLTVSVPWQAWFFGRKGDPKVGFKWTYHYFWGQEDQTGLYFGMWKQVPNNKVVGVLWPNDIDGAAYRNAWPAFLDKAGYKWIDAGLFQDGLEDYTSIIDKFKGAGVEIISGVMSPPDFSNFYKQSKQQGFAPKIVGVGKALLFPKSLEALGSLANNLSTTIWWSPTYPYKSSLTGETCQQVADGYEAKTGFQWTQALLNHIAFEWALDVLKRTKNVDDKEAIISAVASTKLDTLDGTIDFQQPVGTTGTRPVPNVCRSPLAAGQWVKGAKWPFDLKIYVANRPEIPLAGKLVSLS